jgi:hypothetical protein
MISLKDALEFIRKHDYRDGRGEFSIVFMTCNRDKRDGGELIKLTRACMMGLPPNCKGHEMVGIKCMETGKKYAVHNRLIFQLNEQEIFWV